SQTVANEFNRFFNSIPDKVKNMAAFTDWVPPVNHVNSLNSLYLAPITAFEIQVVVKGLANKGAGEDGIPTVLLKNILNNILEPLLFLLNLSLDQGVYPDVLKIAHIVPVFKAGVPLDCSNYRPIF